MYIEDRYIDIIALEHILFPRFYNTQRGKSKCRPRSSIPSAPAVTALLASKMRPGVQAAPEPWKVFGFWFRGFWAWVSGSLKNFATGFKTLNLKPLNSGSGLQGLFCCFLSYRIRGQTQQALFGQSRGPGSFPM